MLKLRNAEINPLALGDTDIGEAYLGDKLIYQKNNRVVKWYIYTDLETYGELYIGGTPKTDTPYKKGTIDLDTQYTWTTIPWHGLGVYVQTVTIMKKIAPKYLDCWFGAFEIIKSIDLSNLDTSETISMSQMFDDCMYIETLDFSNFDTSKVTNMFGMFNMCHGLSSLDLSMFDTSKVTDMGRMFGYSGFKTIYVGNRWSISAVTNSERMFDDCESITGGAGTAYDSSHIDKTYAHIDEGSSNPGYFTEKIPTKVVACWLYSDGELQIAGVQNTNKTVSNTYTLDLTWKCTDTQKIPWCDERTSITSVNIATKIKPTYTCYWFYACYNLASVNAENIDTSNALSIANMFNRCRSLTSIDLSSWNITKVTDISALFTRCTKLASVNFSDWDTSSIVSMDAAFYSCSSLVHLDIANWDTKNVTNMYQMFYGCTSLLRIYATDAFVTTNVTSSGNMFYNCTSLIGGNGTKFSSSYVDKTYARVDKEGQAGYFTQG